MKPITTLLPSFAFLFAGCAATPPAPPEELANTLLTELEAGKVDEARKLFEIVEDDDEYRDKIYPVIYGSARTRYLEGNPSNAAVLLRFLREGYPDAHAVPEALLYALFLQRAGQAEADPALTAEIDSLVSDLREEKTTLPVWMDLIEAQQAFDRGDVELARAAYSRFLATWDRRPNDPLLYVYVDDIGRHLDAGDGEQEPQE
jgi:outer membrane protein assembly factor BamD (BamD/ComL family)